MTLIDDWSRTDKNVISKCILWFPRTLLHNLDQLDARRITWLPIYTQIWQTQQSIHRAYARAHTIQFNRHKWINRNLSSHHCPSSKTKMWINLGKLGICEALGQDYTQDVLDIRYSRCWSHPNELTTGVLLTNPENYPFSVYSLVLCVLLLILFYCSLYFS